MTTKELINIAIIALITFIAVTLPVYLYLRGLPISWGIALLAGYATVAILGYWLGRRCFFKFQIL